MLHLLHTLLFQPSAAVAKAKEAEVTAAAAAAAKAKEAEAAGFDAKDYVVAVVNVDMPPTYGDCGPVPGSPAPSYKSDMAAPAVPGSPAPSYRSVDIPVQKEEKGDLNSKSIICLMNCFL